MSFFQETISDWKDWGRVYQSIPAFTELVREIYRREGLPFFPLQNLTPGTNAVFRVGGTVAKVFFPVESGLDPVPDFTNESAVCRFLTSQGVPTPRVLACGSVEDRYRFYYILTEFVPGTEAGGFLASASDAEKSNFVQELNYILCKLNVPAADLLPPVDLRRQATENPRLAQLSPALRTELKRRAEQADLSCPVLVHGDLTGENLLVQENGRVVVIDCADAHLAPKWYEYGPIVCELFRCDPALTAQFAGEDKERFLSALLDSLAVHDFGPDLLRESAKRAGRPVFQTFKEVQDFFTSLLF